MLLLVFFILPTTGSAHPLDITGTEIQIDIEKGTLETSTFIHPYLSNLLLEENGIFSTYIDTVYEYPEILSDYVQERFRISSAGRACSVESINLPPMDEFELLGGGVELEMTWLCESMGEIEYTNSIFVEYSSLQTNRMFFYQKDKLENSIHEKILTAKVISHSFDINKPNKKEKIVDTDQDFVGDDEEDLYGTDKNLPDTDFDGYSDREEIDNGWDPLLALASLGQKQLVDVELAEKKSKDHITSLTKTSLQEVEELKQVDEVEAEGLIQESYQIGETEARDVKSKDSIEILQFDDKSSYEVVDKEKEPVEDKPRVTQNPPQTENKNQGPDFFQTTKLASVLQKIKTAFESGTFLSILLIFFFVYILGALHAFESGHGKSILISFVVDEKNKLNDAIKFSSVLTFTHLIDIVILVLAFKLFSLTAEASKYMSLIQEIGAYLLLVIAIFYLINNLRPRKESVINYKNATILGIIAGLAPCTIGWALMIAIISINKTEWLVPIIIVFGLGIFSTLLVFSFVLTKLKDRIYKKSIDISRYAGIASSLLLLIIALGLIFL